MVEDEMVTAIDVHTHVMTPEGLPEDPLAGRSDDAIDALASVFGLSKLPSLAEMATYYRQRNMKFVAFTGDDISRTGVEAAVTSRQILEAAGEYSDVMIPFGSVDPNRGQEALDIAERLIALGAKGFKFHASQQNFIPNDQRMYPLYELLQEHRSIALFHTGQSGVGRGVRGGGGLRLKSTNPIYLDDVAVDFPDMPIIMAHPSFPWQDEAIAIALHKPQVYIDLSGWSPKYFPPQLVQYANSLLQDKVLFGSDFPLISPDDWIEAFDRLGIKDTIRPKILRDNAARLLGL